MILDNPSLRNIIYFLAILGGLWMLSWLPDFSLGCWLAGLDNQACQEYWPPSAF
jgi:hypothetical protein